MGHWNFKKARVNEFLMWLALVLVFCGILIDVARGQYLNAVVEFLIFSLGIFVGATAMKDVEITWKPEKELK